jgi:hypothetical protein
MCGWLSATNLVSVSVLRMIFRKRKCSCLCQRKLTHISLPPKYILRDVPKFLGVSVTANPKCFAGYINKKSFELK